ncbi:MAG: hypothetical protein KDA85_02025 [Planctomycetaceae bacterium]|nr:hypothetical protein [Planctomycetaceae bacterium]
MKHREFPGGKIDKVCGVAMMRRGLNGELLSSLAQPFKCCSFELHDSTMIC